MSHDVIVETRKLTKVYRDFWGRRKKTALRALNLPSREQIDRLFERIIGIEERLDDLEDNTRQILRRLRDKSNTTPPDA